jgi:predicted nuclease of restriction endonuclease-like (RecB) superfamily
LGRLIRAEVLADSRAEYGEAVLSGLAKALIAEYGRGFSKRNLHYMVHFAEVFPDEKIVHTLCAQSSWSQVRLVLGMNDPHKRSFYLEMARVQGWSTRRMSDEIDGMLYERVALSAKPEVVIDQQLAALREEDRLTPDMVFRDPYLLDFLGMPEAFSESDLEAAILRELETFLEELGDGFCFVARQKRMSVGNDDFYLDLLFFHRRLRRLVAIELKLGRFMPADVGQMMLYLRWLDRYERLPGEESPLGLILCSEADHERVELLELADGSIRVAQYLTQLPSPELLARRLHEAIARARAGVVR